MRAWKDFKNGSEAHSSTQWCQWHCWIWSYQCRKYHSVFFWLSRVNDTAEFWFSHVSDTIESRQWQEIMPEFSNSVLSSKLPLPLSLHLSSLNWSFHISLYTYVSIWSANNSRWSKNDWKIANGQLNIFNRKYLKNEVRYNALVFFFYRCALYSSIEEILVKFFIQINPFFTEAV
jgi:hypothetical protein